MGADLVQSVIEAHGGLEAYNKLESIEVDLEFTGATLAMKRHEERLILKAVISTKEQKTVIRGFTDETDVEWVYTTNKLYKRRIADQSIVAVREDPVASFAGHVRETPWDDFHLLYFSGYALWQYFNFPYLLVRDDVKSREVEQHHESGQTWRVLEVTYPDPRVLPAHSLKQEYYFNKDLLLQRQNYWAWTMGSRPAAHYTFDNTRVGGMVFSSFRRVVMRGPDEDGDLSPLLHEPTLLQLLFYRIELNQQKTDQSNGAARFARVMLESQKYST